MFRFCLTLVAVALLSACLVHLRDAQGQRSLSAQEAATQIAWVRTVDGWEPSRVLRLRAQPRVTPSLHPVLVATLQLGVSLFALLALPTANLAVRKS